MSFPTTEHYAVLPNAALQELVAHHEEQYKDEMAWVLLKPWVWIWKDNSHHLRTHLIVHQLKLMFLVEEYCDYQDDLRQDTPFLKLVGSIFGEPPFTTARFDLWWELHKISDIVTFEQYEEWGRGRTNFTQLVARTGEPFIDNWIDKLAAK